MYSVLAERDNIIKERDLTIKERDKKIASLSKDVAAKDKRLEVLQVNFTNLQTQNTAKDAEIADLRRRLGL